ncbi:hypothetical protein GCM10027615_08350 [Plantactinospora veratri]
MVVPVDQFGQLGEDLGQRCRALVGAEYEGVDAVQGHLGEHAEGAEPDPGRREDVGVPVGGTLQHLAGAGDQGQPGDEGGEAAVAGAGAVGTGGDRPGDRLRVDVAEIGQGQIVSGEHLVERVQGDPSRYGDQPMAGIDPDRSGQRGEIDPLVVGAGDRGERVAAADRLDPPAGSPGGPNRGDDLVHGRRSQRVAGGALVAGPVRPGGGGSGWCGTSAHLTSAGSDQVANG